MKHGKILAAALVAGLAGAMPARAQSSDQVVTNVVPQAAEMTFQATIKKIDMKTRAVTLVGPTGEKTVVTAGPAVRLEMLKEGDTVTAKYFRAVAFLISSPGAPVPEDEIKAALARPVQTPGGIALKEVRISGLVVGLDLASHRVQLVSPGGGKVWTVEVTDPARQAHLADLKIGDTVTAVVSQALAIMITPAG